MRTTQADHYGLKYHLKRRLLPSGKSARTIQSGFLAGVTMNLDFAYHTQVWLGLYERELNGWLRRLSSNIRSGIDVGAGDGMYTLYFLAKTPAQKVLSFEPDGSRMKQVRENLSLNRLENDPRLELTSQGVGAVSDGQAVTLDSCLSRIEFPCLVKVDIDGGEVALLEGAGQLLASRAVRWVIEVHSPALQERCLQLLRSANYEATVVRNAWWRNLLPDLRPGDLNQWVVATPAERA